MRQLALFTLVLSFGVEAFCQATSIAPAPLQVSPGTPLAPAPFFRYYQSQMGQSSPYANSGNTDFCPGLNLMQNLSGTQAGANPIVRVPCMNPSTMMAMAQSDQRVSPLTVRRPPEVKAEPIPTQWPNARFEPIPTTWPKLKVERIARNTSGTVSTR